MLSTTDLDLLRRHDTPTVCNVIELFDLRPRQLGYLDSRIRACYPRLPPMVGYASTATFRSSAPPTRGTPCADRLEEVAMFAELPGPAVVVFQDLDDPPAAACFGDVSCSTYQAFGAAGLITSGLGRDLNQIEPLGFPCFSSGAICSHGYFHTLSLHVPVRIGGVVINPGDLLHGDRNGVTTIPLEIASAAAHACAEYMAAEAIVLDYLRSGKVDPKGYTAARNECRNRIEALAGRLKAKKSMTSV
jgi:4-hydroxy-4-methyl-2-oxoglutarate aldolase